MTADGISGTALLMPWPRQPITCKAQAGKKASPGDLRCNWPAASTTPWADGVIRKPVAEWMRLGLTLPNDRQVPADAEHLSATLLLPAGYRGPAFLLLDNFRAVLKYNNSSSYALAVNLLSERLSGSGQINGSWPKDDLPLSRSERIDLQTLLNANGYEAGNPDGIIGANTRKAIRSAQQSQGWPADGYPTHKLLESLRNR